MGGTCKSYSVGAGSFHGQSFRLKSITRGKMHEVTSFNKHVTPRHGSLLRTNGINSKIRETVSAMRLGKRRENRTKLRYTYSYK